MTRRRTAALALAAVVAATLATSGCSGSRQHRRRLCRAHGIGRPDQRRRARRGGVRSGTQAPGHDHRRRAHARRSTRRGTCPGAVNVDVSSPDFAAQIATLDPSAPYAVYCRSGNRSGVAVATMAEQGFTNAYHLGGGIGAWQDAGGEVVTG